MGPLAWVAVGTVSSTPILDPLDEVAPSPVPPAGIVTGVDNETDAPTPDGLAIGKSGMMGNTGRAISEPTKGVTFF